MIWPDSDTSELPSPDSIIKAQLVSMNVPAWHPAAINMIFTGHNVSPRRESCHDIEVLTRDFDTLGIEIYPSKEVRGLSR